MENDPAHFVARPEPPAPGESVTFDKDEIRTRVCPDPKCPCGQVPWYFVYQDGELTAGGTDWARLLHYRGHYPYDGLRLGDPIPSTAKPRPPRWAKGRGTVIRLLCGLDPLPVRRGS